jgi:nucleoside phosphorylase
MKSVITMLFVITTLLTGYSVTAAVQAGSVGSTVESSAAHCQGGVVVGHRVTQWGQEQILCSKGNE